MLRWTANFTDQGIVASSIFAAIFIRGLRLIRTNDTKCLVPTMNR